MSLAGMEIGVREMTPGGVTETGVTETGADTTTPC
jgi:hypothetical protein